MERLIEAVASVAKKSQLDGSPEYEIELNGLVVRIKVESDEEFDTAADAVARALVLARELVDADDFVPVSSADVGATVTATPERRGGPTFRWRARIYLILAPAPLDQDRDVPFYPVSGL